MCRRMQVLLIQVTVVYFMLTSVTAIVPVSTNAVDKSIEIKHSFNAVNSQRNSQSKVHLVINYISNRSKAGASTVIVLAMVDLIGFKI